MERIALCTPGDQVDWAKSIDFESAEHLLIASICKAIKDEAKTEFHLVGFEGIAKHFPALQVFLRTNHFKILSYICIDEIPLGKFAEWPDAPVTYIDTKGHQDNANIAKLRNWNVVNSAPSKLESDVISCAELFE